MIIPLSHDSGQVRRAPVVTWALMALCVAVFLGTHGLRDPVLAEVEARLEEARDYWGQHPYLTPPDSLVARYGDLGEQGRRAFDAARERDGVPPVAEDVRRLEQATLESRVEEAESVLRGHVWYRYGLVPASPRAVGLVGHMFLHEGWLHLLGNLLFLYLCGPFVEDRLGRGLFAVFYLASGLAGAALFVLRAPGFDGPLIGASGAIAGAMGAFLVHFWRTQIRFGYWLGFFFGSFRAPALLMLPLWFANELISARLLEAAGTGSGGVAYWAHVGGFGFGATVAVLVTVLRIGGEHDDVAGLQGHDEAPGSDARGQPSEVAETARQLIAQGRPADAVELLRTNLGDEEDFGTALMLADAMRRAGPIAASSARDLQAPLASAVAKARREVAVRLWKAICQAGGSSAMDLDAGPRLDAATCLKLVPWLRTGGEAGLALAALWAALRAPCDGASALRVARAARGFDPVLALRAAEQALSDPELADEERPRLDALLRESEDAAKARGIVVLPRSEVPPRPEPAPSGPPLDSRTPEAQGAFEGRALDVDLDDDAPWPVADEAPRPVADEAPRPVADEAPRPVADEAPECPQPSAQDEPSPLFDSGFEDDLSAEPEMELHDLDAEPDLDDAALAAALGSEPRTEPKDSETAPLGQGASIPPRRLRLLEGRPLELADDALWLEVEGRGRTRLPLARIDAIGLAGVRGLGRPKADGEPRAVVLIDLALNWVDDPEEPLLITRLRSDGFDPRRVIGATGSPLTALRELVAQLQRRSRAHPLTPAASHADEPLEVHRDLATYERLVLGGIG